MCDKRCIVSVLILIFCFACLAGFAEASNLLLAEYHVWHGLDSHTDAWNGSRFVTKKYPYDSTDPNVIARHIREAKARGIQGFVVNWYGPGLAPNDERSAMDSATTELLRQAAKTQDFHVALMYDEGAVSSQKDKQARMVKDLKYAVKTHLGKSAYLRIEKKTALFIFPKPEVDPDIDWGYIRKNVPLGDEILLLDKDPNPADVNHDNHFDGFYAWVSAASCSSSPCGADYGNTYLEWFYATMSNEAPYKNKLMVGCLWPGFDDSLAPWGHNRFISRKGMQTWHDTSALADKYNAPVRMIATWNDFEEGTDIEYGIDMTVKLDTPEADKPNILPRTSPVTATWDSGKGDAILQIYQNGHVIYESKHSPGVSLNLDTHNIYEIKIWITGESKPFAQFVKIRRQDEYVFDEAWYLRANPDVARAVQAGAFSSGLHHYKVHGFSEKRQPNAHMAPKSIQCPGIDTAGASNNPESTENAITSCLLCFNEFYYRYQYPDVENAVKKGAFVSGWQHFITHGIMEKRSPNDHVDLRLINCPQYDDAVQSGNLKAAKQSLLDCSLCSMRTLFEEGFYLRTYPDVATAVENGMFTTGWQHFYLYGWNEKRNPSSLIDIASRDCPSFSNAISKKNEIAAMQVLGFSELCFDEATYLGTYADVYLAVKNGVFTSGWQHFAIHGILEKRNFNAKVDLKSLDCKAYDKAIASKDPVAALEAVIDCLPNSSMMKERKK